MAVAPVTAPSFEKAQYVNANFFNLYQKNYLNKTNVNYPAKRTREMQLYAPKYIVVDFPLSSREVERIRRSFLYVSTILNNVRGNLKSLRRKPMGATDARLTSEFVADVRKYWHQVRIQKSIWEAEISKKRAGKTRVEIVNFPLTPMYAPFMNAKNRLQFKRNGRTIYASRQLQSLLNRVGDHYIRVMHMQRPTVPVVPKTGAPTATANARGSAVVNKGNTMKGNARSNMRVNASNMMANAKITVPRINTKTLAPRTARNAKNNAVPTPRRFGLFRKGPQPIPAPSAQQSWFQRIKQLNARRLMPRMVWR